MIRHVLPPTNEQLERAREIIAKYLQPTPTITLSLRGRPVLAKLECLQVTGSFKVRGALAAVDAAKRDDPHGAVITASAGNHGLGVAHAAQLLDVRATVVVPANASVAKVKKLSTYDIELIQFGMSYDDAQAHAIELSDERSIRFISPFNDSNVIAGQSTVFDEMLAQVPELEHLAVSVGGGGLISGTLLSREVHGRNDIQVTGIQAEESAALYHVLRGMRMSDVVHHPIQVYEPTWNTRFCEMPDQARSTRRRVLEHCVEHGALLFPTHFAPPHVAAVQSKADRFHPEFVAEAPAPPVCRIAREI